MGRLLAIDPANVRTAYVLLTEDFQIIDKGILYNEDFILMLKEGNYDAIAVEIIVSYGLRVGESVFSTAEMIGRRCVASNGCWGLYFRFKQIKKKFAKTYVFI